VLRTVKSTGAKNFFSSLFTSFSATPPQRSDLQLPEEVTNPLSIDETSVSLSIFSADVAVRLDRKLSVELHRSTKKNPPNKLKYELIYVSAL
jgi:alpha-D-ribose 1-methylphosphonate 5-triphosphate synthase subunit PhnH